MLVLLRLLLSAQLSWRHERLVDRGHSVATPPGPELLPVLLDHFRHLLHSLLDDLLPEVVVASERKGKSKPESV